MKRGFIVLLIACMILISGCSGNKAENNAADAQTAQPDPQAKTESAGQGNTPSDAGNPADAENIIYINHFVFEPSELAVSAGAKVTWIHNDNVAHTVVMPGMFESDVLKRGGEFSFTFDRPGEYTYHCSIHPSMEGTIIVK